MVFYSSYAKFLLIFWVGLLPLNASAERLEIDFHPKVDFSIVCLEEPRQEGWSYVTWADEELRNRLLINLAAPPNRPLPFAQEPYLYRLVVRGTPCFYEYASHAYRGHGTYLGWKDVFSGYVIIDNYEYRRVEEDELMVPLIRTLVSECEEKRSGEWPFTFVLACEEAIADLLFTEVDSLSIFFDPDDPSAFVKIIFVFGEPYLNGKRIFEF